jgi:4-hydroxybenzoate polyprenyltransferase
LDAAVKLNRKNKKDSFYYCLFVLSAVLALIFRFFRINPIFILIGAAVTGLLYSLVILKLKSNIKGGKSGKGGADK